MGDLPGGMFSHDSPCLIPDGRPTLHRSKPISLRSTPSGFCLVSPLEFRTACHQSPGCFSVILTPSKPFLVIDPAALLKRPCRDAERLGKRMREHGLPLQDNPQSLSLAPP